MKRDGDSTTAKVQITLRHLTHTSCPECGAPWVTIGYKHNGHHILSHVNGGVWETITFSCGRSDGYVPNFMHIETYQLCRNSEFVRAETKRKETALISLRAAVEKANLNDSERDSILRNIDSSLRRY